MLLPVRVRVVSAIFLSLILHGSLVRLLFWQEPEETTDPALVKMPVRIVSVPKMHRAVKESRVAARPRKIRRVVRPVGPPGSGRLPSYGSLLPRAGEMPYGLTGDPPAPGPERLGDLMLLAALVSRHILIPKEVVRRYRIGRSRMHLRVTEEGKFRPGMIAGLPFFRAILWDGVHAALADKPMAGLGKRLRGRKIRLLLNYERLTATGQQQPKSDVHVDGGRIVFNFRHHHRDPFALKLMVPLHVMQKAGVQAWEEPGRPGVRVGFNILAPILYLLTPEEEEVESAAFRRLRHSPAFRRGRRY